MVPVILANMSFRYIGLHLNSFSRTSGLFYAGVNGKDFRFTNSSTSDAFEYKGEKHYILKADVNILPEWLKI